MNSFYMQYFSIINWFKKRCETDKVIEGGKGDYFEIEKDSFVIKYE